MYNDLWTNGPFEINEYPDYTLLDHFKGPYQSHPPRTVCRQYMEGLLRPTVNVTKNDKILNRPPKILYRNTQRTFSTKK
jgi:hypothetical protein